MVVWMIYKKCRLKFQDLNRIKNSNQWNKWSVWPLIMLKNIKLKLKRELKNRINKLKFWEVLNSKGQNKLWTILKESFKLTDKISFRTIWLIFSSNSLNSFIKHYWIVTKLTISKLLSSLIKRIKYSIKLDHLLLYNKLS